ncbi:glycosyltransferase [Microlunatus flavus]|uniref:Glycosyl transferase family 21 n=1 Tax=Microlunatus flavus TaxID=1036181 RepID=A0A1H9DI52_9ACTN|nr:glycosyltransferase [Microlunatus flavus]SEQ13155.1 Glycosyl transferase family 21 [Microlunatus flavus]
MPSPPDPLRPAPLAMEYVLPLRWGPEADPRDAVALAAYLERLATWLDVTVVDGSPAPVFERHQALFPRSVRHLAPGPWPGCNGKVAGVMTGVRTARHANVVIADDDVRWDRPGLARLDRLLAQAPLVRPQNVFVPAPWHAREDTGRSLLNRALGADYPGTYGLRRDALLDAGGYDGDVLFENLELARTLRAAGGRELCVPDLFVVRVPPTARQFLGQRVRQAYDDLAQPPRLVCEMALLPAALTLLDRAARSDRTTTRRAARRALTVLALSPVLLAEVGRRRHGGATVYPATAPLWAPFWLAERAVCVWLALGHRLRGGVPYRGQRLRVAAHGVRTLRRRVRPVLGRLAEPSPSGSVPEGRAATLNSP